MTCILTLAVLVVSSAATCWAVPAPDLSYVRPGQCLVFRHLDPVNYQKLSGSWFEVSSRPNVFQEARMCLQYHFRVDGDKVVVERTSVDGKGQLHKVTTTLHPEGHEQSPEAEVRFVGIPTTRSTVVGTDYASFACLYHCQQVSKDNGKGRKVEWGFAMVRDLKEASLAKKKCKKIFDALGFDVSSLMSSPHPEEACNVAPTDDTLLPQEGGN